MRIIASILFLMLRADLVTSAQSAPPTPAPLVPPAADLEVDTGDDTGD